MDSWVSSFFQPSVDHHQVVSNIINLKNETTDDEESITPRTIPVNGRFKKVNTKKLIGLRPKM